jgi:hypothetical protein
MAHCRQINIKAQQSRLRGLSRVRRHPPRNTLTVAGDGLAVRLAALSGDLDTRPI